MRKTKQIFIFLLVTLLSQNIFASNLPQFTVDWKDTEVAKTVQDKYKTTSMPIGEIYLSLKPLNTHNLVQVSIQSKLNLKTIDVYEESKPSKPTTSFEVSKNSLINYSFPIQVKKSSYITVISKDTEGKLYKTTQWVDFSTGKMKAKSYPNGVTKVKVMFISQMAGPREASKRNIAVEYVKRVQVRAGDTLVFDVKTSEFISRNPLFKFRYKGKHSPYLTLETIDNNENIRTKTIKAKLTSPNSPSIQNTDKLKKDPNIFPVKDPNIKKLYGDVMLIEDGITLKAPKLAENGGSIPINIKSNIKFKSIAVFASGHDIGSDLDFICQFFSTPFSITNFDIRLKMRDRGNIRVILEAESGEFYTAEQKVEVSIGGGAG